MPIYEYQCQACEHEFETLQKMADAPLVDCPECGEATLKKKISAAGFRLSGSGWYETDFKSGKNKKNLAGESGEKNTKEQGEKKDQGASKKTQDNEGSGKKAESPANKQGSQAGKSATSKD